MPRKVSYGVDYDDYEDYDYYYETDVDNYDFIATSGPPATNEKISVRGIWRCPICTYDNDESMVACDICGILHNPPARNGDKKSVDGMCKDSGTSIMAKSLFTSLPHRTPEKAVIFQQANNGSVSQAGNSTASPSSNAPSSTSVKNNAAMAKSIAKRTEKSSSSKPMCKQDGIDESSCTSTRDDKERSISSNMEQLSLNSAARHLKNLNFGAEASTSRGEYKPEKWMVPDPRENNLTQLNLAIVGHVDSGKSTLSGRLLHLLGRISQKEMHKYEKEARIQGKGSFAYAWALDESSEERARGITMTVAVAYFDTKKYHVVLLDSPGHKDFVPNMISGATQADAAFLVVDASVGSFEAGMDNSGQTREHARLIRSFGVDQVIVAVNKLDAVEYSQERFEMIKTQLGTFLRSCNFKDSSVLWIPLSATQNQNLAAGSSDVRLSSWYHGPYLLDALDSLQPPTREFSKPLRMPICDVVQSSLGQMAASGKLEAGALRSGSKVLLMPSGDLATVRSLERNTQACNIARAGDNVSVNLHGVDSSRIAAGGVLCHPDFPVEVANYLELKVLLLEVATPILVGSQLEFHAHHVKEAARVVKISWLLDPKTGKTTKKAPRCLISRQSAVIEVVLHGAVCVEEFSKCRALGRVFLRSLGGTVAVGIVTRVVKQDS